MKDLLKILMIGVFGFLSIQALSQRKDFVPKRIVFEQTMVFEGYEPSKISNRSASKDSLLKPGKASKILEGLDGMQKMLVLELKEDSLWRYETWNEILMSDYSLITKDGKIHTFLNREKLVVRGTLDNFKSVSRCEISIDKKNVKSILGLTCHKVKIEAPIIGSGKDTSIYVYEMYVTNLIKLPIFSMINVDRNYPFFPLEMKMYLKSMPDLSEHFKAISIDKYLRRKM